VTDLRHDRSGLLGVSGISADVRRLLASDSPHAAEALGRLDAEANDRGPGCISAPGSRVAVWVVPTDEELVVARHTRAALVRAGAPPG
jgi:acetate kinase